MAGDGTAHSRASVQLAPTTPEWMVLALQSIEHVEDRLTDAIKHQETTIAEQKAVTAEMHKTIEEMRVDWGKIQEHNTQLEDGRKAFGKLELGVAGNTAAHEGCIARRCFTWAALVGLLAMLSLLGGAWLHFNQLDKVEERLNHYVEAGVAHAARAPKNAQVQEAALLTGLQEQLTVLTQELRELRKIKGGAGTSLIPLANNP